MTSGHLLQPVLEDVADSDVGAVDVADSNLGAVDVADRTPGAVDVADRDLGAGADEVGVDEDRDRDGSLVKLMDVGSSSNNGGTRLCMLSALTK